MQQTYGELVEHCQLYSHDAHPRSVRPAPTERGVKSTSGSPTPSAWVKDAPTFVDSIFEYHIRCPQARLTRLLLCSSLSVVDVRRHMTRRGIDSE